MSAHDIVTAILVVFALLAGTEIGKRIERRRYTYPIQTILPQPKFKSTELIPPDDL